MTEAAAVVEDGVHAGAAASALAAEVERLVAVVRRVEGYDPAADVARAA